MTDEKMIEEMAKILCDRYGTMSDCKMLACYLYSQNYRKLPENAVVLTREEYEDLKIAKDFDYGYHNGESNMTLYYENIRLPEVRKETAREILKYLMQFEGYAAYAGEELAKKYGVEVE